MCRNNMKKVKHLNTSKQKHPYSSEVNNRKHKHERDSGVRGSPQTQGYVHQMVASCDIYFIKRLQINNNIVAALSFNPFFTRNLSPEST